MRWRRGGWSKVIIVLTESATRRVHGFIGFGVGLVYAFYAGSGDVQGSTALKYIYERSSHATIVYPCCVQEMWVRFRSNHGSSVVILFDIYVCSARIDGM